MVERGGTQSVRAVAPKFYGYYEFVTAVRPQETRESNRTEGKVEGSECQPISADEAGNEGQNQTALDTNLKSSNESTDILSDSGSGGKTTPSSFGSSVVSLDDYDSDTSVETHYARPQPLILLKEYGTPFVSEDLTSNQR